MSNTDLLSGEPQSQADASESTAGTSGSESSTGSETAGSSNRPAADAQAGDSASDAEGATKQSKRRAGGLSGMVIADLRELAGELGVDDTTGMRKGDLIAAIRERQGKTKRKGGSSEDAGETDEATTTAKRDHAAASSGQSRPETKDPETKDAAPESSDERGTTSSNATESNGKQQGSEAAQQQTGSGQSGQHNEDGTRSGSRRRRNGANRAGNSEGNGNQRGGDGSTEESGSGAGETRQGDRQQNDRQQNDRQQNDRQQGDRQRSDRQQGDRQQGDRQQGDRQQGDRQQGDRQQNDRQQNDRQQNDRQQNDRQQNARQGDDERGGRRGRRHRDRRRRGGGRTDSGPDTEVRDDDVLLPVAGILDVLDNYAFVRTSGYLAGPNDVYVSLSHVRKYGLRRGDAITGVVRQPREGEQQRQKFNPLVRVDTVNGLDPEVSKKRTEFTKLTPLYPNERLRLETEANKLTTRVVDLAMPVGKGQRALVVSPPKAGKTTILQEIANAITTNNPECHLMVVLVDERPEEVTDMQRSVNGEVIAATFDRPPSDHTTLAELAIERAKRLVEMGHDVVVLLDSVTRLGRAYNLAAPASGRILSGGVDSTALYPPKRFLGAARNIEEGGSLTIFATALVETGSTGDSVIFEEFKGTGNAELKLDRKIAEKRTFPAVDVNASGTRKEELLLSPEELAVTHRLHRVLHALDQQQAIDLLLDRLRKSKTNIEFLTQVAKQAPGDGEE